MNVIGNHKSSSDRYAIWHSLLQIRDCWKDSEKRGNNVALRKEQDVYELLMKEYLDKPN